MKILNLDEMPENPIERLVWLSGVDSAVRRELNAAWQEAYFDARVQGMLPEALDLRLHATKRVMAWTRHENEARGRVITRWRDGH